MRSNSQAFRQYLKRREDTREAEEISREDSLYDEKTFYRKFINDFFAAKKEVIIYSPFVSKFRTDYYKRIIGKLRDRNVDVFIFTRPVEEYDNILQAQIKVALKKFEEMGVCVYYPGKYIHQKAAIIDREILWEGSLNILSHRGSNEMMRRTEGENPAMQVLNHLKLNESIAEAYKLKYEKLYMGLSDKSGQSLKAKTKIFLIGLSVPVIAWLIVNLMFLRPSQITEIITNLIKFLVSHS